MPRTNAAPIGQSNAKVYPKRRTVPVRATESGKNGIIVAHFAYHCRKNDTNDAIASTFDSVAQGKLRCSQSRDRHPEG
ncbi:hypothetical protein DFP92_10719 [Yoonia sediminilitoris]|uniref:Uncharacterized protein n=1 Tax=Yoonia sediminilitoris TaxID=1286148 RepID=A0A2T6KEL3_9RHOB|nr:hypothetical protein C8N45_10719 [Yoonia sediminilitoris]RCW94731.1 hypothetical protein DFP92_10719 [Yoonia sediminilitoris]